MSDIFLNHIYLMYSLWFAAGILLLAYIAYRRRRRATTAPVLRIKA